MANISAGQRKILEEASRIPVIVGEIPEYWNPKPLRNDQIQRLVNRGFLTTDETSFFKITDKGIEELGLVRCLKCSEPTHPQESACIHCGSMKSWAVEAEPK